MTADQIWQLSIFYKVFSDETRLKILYVLMDGTCCVSEISEKLGISPSAISHQLRTLRQLNLVSTKKVGKEVYYQLSDHHIEIILQYGMEHIFEGGEHHEVRG